MIRLVLPTAESPTHRIGNRLSKRINLYKVLLKRMELVKPDAKRPALVKPMTGLLKIRSRRLLS